MCSIFLNIGLPPPKTTGVTKIPYSSIRPSRMKVDPRLALPNKAMSLPRCRFSRLIFLADISAGQAGILPLNGLECPGEYDFRQFVKRPASGPRLQGRSCTVQDSCR